jgi:ferredoxin-NADP reductase
VSLTFPPSPSSALAVVTTVHLALASLRNHRRPGPSPVSSLTIVSVLFAAAPWLFPSAAGLAAGLAAHALWFAVCERFTPRLAGAAAARSGQAPGAGSPTARPAAAVSKPKGFVQVPVLAVLEESEDIRTFRFARPEGFDFVAGQFLTVRVKVDGRDHVRCYSISSVPAASGYLEISVKRQGLVSHMLHATLRPGALVAARAPNGVFRYPAGDDRALLLIAGGIGITPVLSMLRHAVHTEPHRAVTLLYSAQSEGALAFRDEIAAIARRHPQVNVVFAVTRGATGPGVFPGRIDDTLIRATVPHVDHAIAMICGPQPMIDAMRVTLAGLGMPAAQIRSEVFEQAIAASGGKQVDETEAPGGETFRMTCARSGSAVPVAPGQTLLEAAESGGIEIDSLCRAGVCGTCRTRVLDGHVDCESTALDDADRGQGYVLACVARIRGNCTVEA